MKAENQAKRRAEKPLLTVSIAQETDFLLARRRAAELAGLLQMDTQEQTRIATAVSEIARNAMVYAGGGKVEYFIDREPRLALRIVVQDSGPGIPHLQSIWNGTYRSESGMGLGLLGAKRLSDVFTIDSDSKGTRITLVKHAGLPQLGADSPTDEFLVKALSPLKGADATTALASQNQELIQVLDQLRARELELERLNRELEETNRGVMVLYSELEDKADAVQQANEMKTRFLSSVTHELRTPLNSVVSLARLLLARVDGELSDEQEKQVQFILRSAQNLTEMVNDLLDLGKIEAGKITVRRARVSVHDVFAALRGMFRPLATNEHVELRLEALGPQLELMTDEGKLAQILRNLISNALKFTERGSVVAKAWRQDDSIYFSVVDTGIGIAPEHRELVLQEWAQVEGSGVPRHAGSGLGLPLAKKLAELLGGDLWFESELGIGSQFHVRIPVGQSEQPKVSELPVIVVVEDDEVSRYLVRRRLAALTSAPVLEAVNGRAGLELIRAKKPVLVLLDLMMPEMTGFEVAQELRNDPQTVDLPVLVITSKELTPQERKTLEGLKVEVIGKKDVSTEEHNVYLERALLEVGLNNLHEGHTQAPTAGRSDPA